MSRTRYRRVAFEMQGEIEARGYRQRLIARRRSVLGQARSHLIC